MFKGLMCAYFTSLSELGTPELSPFETFLCGAFAGIMASVTTQPADVVKTRIQLFPHKYSGTGSAVFSILKVKHLIAQVLIFLFVVMRQTVRITTSKTIDCSNVLLLEQSRNYSTSH